MNEIYRALVKREELTNLLLRTEPRTGGRNVWRLAGEEPKEIKQEAKKETTKGRRRETGCLKICNLVPVWIKLDCMDSEAPQ